MAVVAVVTVSAGVAWIAWGIFAVGGVFRYLGSRRPLEEPRSFSFSQRYLYGRAKGYRLFPKYVMAAGVIGIVVGVVVVVAAAG